MDRLRRFWVRYGAFILIALFLASLIPIVLLGRYDRASADDYTYGIFPHLALRQGHGFAHAVWRTATGYYESWQGTFTALALMSLTPCIFSEWAYWLTPVVMLASLIGGTVKLCDTLVRRALGGGRRQVVFLCVPLLFLSIQCVASPLHTFYWWNGAVYYTFTYGMMLLLVERLLALRLAKTKGQTLLAVLPGVLCAFLVGGSNYVSNLLGILLGGLFLLWFLLRERRKLLWALVIVGVQAVCFGVSVLAPGNQVRQSASAGMGPVTAVVRSILRAGYDALDYLNWPILLTFLALIPVLWGLTEKASFRFPWPPAFSVFTFLLFAAQNAPHYYAMSVAGPERLRSIVYYAYFWLLLSNEWYWLGWFRRALLPWVQRRRLVRRGVGGYLSAVLACLALLCICVRLPNMTAGGCARQLADGSAAAYAGERDARLGPLLDERQPNPRFDPITVRPPYLYYTDITEDPADWKNNVVRMFFEKESVALTPAP